MPSQTNRRHYRQCNKKLFHRKTRISAVYRFNRRSSSYEKFIVCLISSAHLHFPDSYEHNRMTKVGKEQPRYCVTHVSFGWVSSYKMSVKSEHLQQFYEFIVQRSCEEVSIIKYGNAHTGTWWNIIIIIIKSIMSWQGGSISLAPQLFTGTINVYVYSYFGQQTIYSPLQSRYIRFWTGC